MDRLILIFFLCTGIFLSTVETVGGSGGERIPGTVNRQHYGTLPDGSEVICYQLKLPGGIALSVINYGMIITRLRIPDREGKVADVVLGFDTLEDYLEYNPYFGSIVGRFANRIAKGRFSLAGREYHLAANDGSNHLHGGRRGFDRVLWKTGAFSSPEGVGVSGEYLSPDGEEGYPGNLRVEVRYTLTPDRELRIEYTAVTDRRTIVNLSHHSYFNLEGHDQGSITGHELMINADQFTPVDEGLIPTGEILPVAATPMDFTRPKKIGRDIGQNHPQLQYGHGYDHNWVLNREGGGRVLAARVIAPRSGRILEVYTDQPGLQFYSGNFLDGSLEGKNGTRYRHRQGFCLEAQHFPDSPHHSHFPSTELEPGDTYRQVTVYRWGVQKDGKEIKSEGP